MIYSVIKKFLGTSKTENLLEIQTDLEMADMCYIPEFGFIFAFPFNHCLGYSDFNGKCEIPWMGQIGKCKVRDGNKRMSLFDCPSSLCYFGRAHECYVVERGGENIRRIEIDSKYVSSFLGKSPLKILSKYFSKVGHDRSNIKTAIDVNYKKEIYWVSQSVHRCLKYSSSSVKCFVGNGRCGYSVSNSLGSCFLNSPAGICCNKNSLYISDTGNGCLRRVDENSIKLVGGSPNSNDLSTPIKIKIKDNICYVLDGGCIKNITLSSNEFGATYFRDGIVSFDLDKSGNLIILERRS